MEVRLWLLLLLWLMVLGVRSIRCVELVGYQELGNAGCF